MGEYVEVISQSTLWGVDFLMIFVSLGTQDRSFKRLLEAVEHQIELGNIKEKVIVQAGVTKFESKYMEIFDLISVEEYEKLISECNVLICHGGVGTIIDGLKRKKKVIAAARLKEFDEHQNNHQKQIIHEFVKNGLVLELEDFEKLDEKLKEVKKFQPNTYKSNTDEFIKMLEGYIDSSLKNNKGDHYRKFMQYGFYGVFALIFEILVYFMFKSANINGVQFFGILAFYIIFYRSLMHHIFFSTVSFDLKGEFIFYILLFLPMILSFWQYNYYPSLIQVVGIMVIRFFLIYVLNSFLHVKDVELH